MSEVMGGELERGGRGGYVVTGGGDQQLDSARVVVC